MPSPPRAATGWRAACPIWPVASPASCGSSCRRIGSRRLRAAVTRLEGRGLRIVIETNRSEESGEHPAVPAREMELELLGLDRPGLVREVSRLLAQAGINVEELSTDRSSAPMSAEMMFRARARLHVPAGVDIAVVRTGLERLAGDLMVEIRLAGTRTFESAEGRTGTRAGESRTPQPRVRLQRRCVQRSELGEVRAAAHERAAEAPPELIVGAVVRLRASAPPAGLSRGFSSTVGQAASPRRPPALILDAFRGERTRQRRAYFRTSAYLLLRDLACWRRRQAQGGTRPNSPGAHAGRQRRRHRSWRPAWPVIPEDLVGDRGCAVPQKLQPGAAHRC